MIRRSESEKPLAVSQRAKVAGGKSEIRNQKSEIPFTLLLDAPASGAWNMAVDQALLEAAADDGRCMLRFYQWAEPTLSLGYFQAYADRRRHRASRDCPAVRRLSGGGAILHDFDLTYSLAIPQRHPWAADRLHTYRVIHEALIAALAHWSIAATLSVKQPTFEREPFLCFQRRAEGDVLVGCEKVAGSAQRRCRGAVLQHGSVLLARSAAAGELPGLKESTGQTLSVDELREVWLGELSAGLAVAWRRGNLSPAHRRRAAALVAEKYSSPAWTCVR
jgi:lipoate-protein ligase A